MQEGPIEPWIPVITFAVVFGLSMGYEVFLASRVREEWLRCVLLRACSCCSVRPPGACPAGSQCGYPPWT